MKEDDNTEARRYFSSNLEAVREALADTDKHLLLMQDCLCIEVRINVHIQLSTGGPGDGFEIACDAATGEPLHGCHYFVNRGFRREIPLSQDELSDICAAYGIEIDRSLPFSSEIGCDDFSGVVSARFRGGDDSDSFNAIAHSARQQDPKR